MKKGNVSTAIVIGVIAVCALFGFTGLSSFALVDPSEGYYAEGAREMLERGDYIVPHLNYTPYYEKPVLIYWLISFAYRCLGVSEFASRVPSTLAAIVLTVVVFAVSRRFLSNRAALYASLIMLSSPLFLVVKNLALTDMVFTSFYSIASLSLFRFLEDKRQSFFWTGYMFLGLAMLCKGPLALVLISLAFVGYALVESRQPRQIIDTISRLRPVAGLAVALLVCLPWYIAVHCATDGEFTREFFIDQNLGRLTKLVPQNHSQPFWFFIPVLFAGMFPWSIFLLGQVLVFKRKIVGRMSTRRHRFLAFAACSALTGFCLLSCAASKLPTYILPLLPSFAVLVGSAFELCTRLRTIKLILVNVAVTVTLAIIGMSVAPFLCSGTDLCTPVVVTLALTTLGYLLVLAMPKRQMSLAVTTFLCLTLVCVSQMVPLGLRVNDETNHAGLKNIMMAAKRNDAAVASYMRGSPAAGFYYERKVPHLTGPPDLYAFYNQCSDSQQPCWLISTVEVTKTLTDNFPQTRLLAREGRWYLYSLSSASREDSRL